MLDAGRIQDTVISGKLSKPVPIFELSLPGRICCFMGFIAWICHSLIVSCKPVYIFSETCGLHSAPDDAVEGMSAGKSPSYRKEKGHKPNKIHFFYERIKYFFFGIKSVFKME